MPSSFLSVLTILICTKFNRVKKLKAEFRLTRLQNVYISQKIVDLSYLAAFYSLIQAGQDDLASSWEGLFFCTVFQFFKSLNYAFFAVCAFVALDSMVELFNIQFLVIILCLFDSVTEFNDFFVHVDFLVQLLTFSFELLILVYLLLLVGKISTQRPNLILKRNNFRDDIVRDFSTACAAV